MVLNFQIHYKTSIGDRLRIKFTLSSYWSDEYEYVECSCIDGENWTANLNIKKGKTVLYKYELLEGHVIREEYFSPRRIDTANGKSVDQIFVKDFWRDKSNKLSIFMKSAFTDVLLKYDDEKAHTFEVSSPNEVRFNLFAPNIDSKHYVGVVGSQIGERVWNEVIILKKNHNGLHTAVVTLPSITQGLEYKYVLCDKESGKISLWEEGQNRLFYPSIGLQDYAVIINDDYFRTSTSLWKGAGLAIPIFSQRSKNGFGIGEFLDLKLTIDLSSKLGMGILQILPVNDTLANLDWSDSYPYAAISVFALHPLYINIETIARFSKEDQKQYLLDKENLNSLDIIDFDQVLNLKLKYLDILYRKEKSKFLLTKEYKTFLGENNTWIWSYTVFCSLRDKFKTPDFSKWGQFSTFKDVDLEIFKDSRHELNDKVHFYAFIQYHLDSQLKAMKDYGRDKKVVLKGDLPIGIYRYSCDAWTDPSLYHMDQQAGAPPDDYAVNGQNWGFPTYNWQAMARDNFAWWRSRMTKLSEYFDAIRIDHILGFFRIWSIPMSNISGTLGLFSPRLPYDFNDLAGFGLKGDIKRYSTPFIRRYYLHELFGKDVNYVIEHYLIEVFEQAYQLKEELNTQVKIVDYFAKEENVAFQRFVQPLCALLTEVLLIEEPNSNGQKFNPRITMQSTYSYLALDDYAKRAMDKIYNDYFYKRHGIYWRDQAYTKLPALLDATNMLICGEDLGMIPDTVPEVMNRLNIVPLEIQRMPKGDTLFGDCSEYDYYSVCSPSCHDMSTIRGWWEGSNRTAQNYWTFYMAMKREYPRECSEDVVTYIVNEHLQSPSILAIFPIQDILGMNAKLKRLNPFVEQINDPSNSKHYWRYRLHLNIEDIISDDEFCEKVKQMVIESGR